MTARPLPPRERLLAAAGLVFNALTWGLSWWPFRHLQAQGLHPLALTTLIFTTVLVVISLSHRHAWGLLARQRRLWWLVLAAGCTNACFNWAVSIGDVLRVVLLFYLMPLWTVLLARAVLGERVDRAGALRVVLALGGAMVMLWPDARTLSQPLQLADALALVGGFSFALNNVMLRREAASEPEARALAMFLGGALVSAVAVALLPAGTPTWPSAEVPWIRWVPLAGLLAVWFLGSNLTLQYGAARLPANTASVLMISEVAFAGVSSVLAGASQLQPQLLAGGALILTATLLAAWRRS